jgi:hypothetical protein
MFIDEKGAAIFIDQEWLFSKDLSMGYISFRALLISFSSVGTAARPCEDKYLNVLQLLTHAMKCINIDLTQSRVKEYLDLEGALDQLTNGRQQTYSSEELAIWFASLKLRMFDTQTPVHEKLAQQNEQLAIVTQTLAQRDQQLADISNSRSWRLVRPLRTLRKWLNSL